MAKLVKFIIIFGPVGGSVKVIKKYSNPGQNIDESLMSTLCLPRIQLFDQPTNQPLFQTFLVTKEDGQVLYGSGLIVCDRLQTPAATPGAPRYANFCYTIITDIPFINATKSLLELIWLQKCDDLIIKTVMNIPLPPRRRCLRIVPPAIANSAYKSAAPSKSKLTLPQAASPTKTSPTTNNHHNKNVASTNLVNAQKPAGNASTSTNQSQLQPKANNNSQGPGHALSKSLYRLTDSRAMVIDDIYLYRGMADLPLLDYPLRELFNFLHVDDFLLAFACILMEFRTLIISQDNYKLMMVGETLTSLLLPLKWCNVYVPILPPVYGATYLDAPTSYIMGINTQVTDLPDNLNHVQCRIYCDESRVVCDADSLALPLFLNDIKRDIMKIMHQFSLSINLLPSIEDVATPPATPTSPTGPKLLLSQSQTHQQQSEALPNTTTNDTAQQQTVNQRHNNNNNDMNMNNNRNKFTYLDDLKFNRAIRVLFMKTIRKNILANYERYIVDVPESSADVRQFDVVSYLSDKPEFMYSFLSKFLDTQLFASFIDENAKRMQQSWLSIFDMDPDELSEHFSDRALEIAFQSAERIHLMDLRCEEPEFDIKTVPASPMKLRRRVPGAAGLLGRLGFNKMPWSSGHHVSIDHGTVGPLLPITTSSPPMHRNSIATVQLKGHLSLDPSLNQPVGLLRQTPHNPGAQHNNNNGSPSNNNNNNNGRSDHNSPGGPVPVSQGKITEMLGEVKDLSKRILVDQMGSPVLEAGSDDSSKPRSKPGSGDTDNNLIGALCDHIERVWAHGAFTSHQDSAASCPLWNHLVAYTRLKYLDSKPSKNQFADGSHLNVLSPARQTETSELDAMMIFGSSEGPAASTQSNLFNTFNWFKSKRFERIGPMARDLINDLRTIHTLKDVKTDVGRARAFIRLSLERKKLSKHLKTLLSDSALLNSLYKPYAFLRCEDEREQFLMYLLTLNAVDLPCFTNTFVSVINTRRMKHSVS